MTNEPPSEPRSEMKKNRAGSTGMASSSGSLGMGMNAAEADENLLDELGGAGGRASLMAMSWSGALPPPSALDAFGRIDPTFPERIMAMSEREQAHRHELESGWQENLIEDRKRQWGALKRGQVFGLVMGVLCLSVAGLAVWMDRPWVAGLLGGGTLVAVVTVFVTRQGAKRRGEDEVE